MRTVSYTAFHLLLVFLMVFSLTGCYPTKAAKEEKQVDVIAIQPGVARANAEGALGTPVRSWTSPSGIRYATYEYQLANPALGLGPYLSKLIRDRIILSYDDRDIILGIFNEFDELPLDGRSGQRKWGPEGMVPQ